MKNIYKQSTVLFMALAVIAMILTGCKKSDSSNSGGGDTPTPPTPPAGNYGTVTVGNQSYPIAIGGYEVYYDEDLQANVVTVALADGTNETANMFGFTIPNVENLPTGTFAYCNENPVPAGKCVGIFRNSNGDLLYCTAGSVTITASGSNYKIQSSGKANIPIGSPATEQNFAVNFEGPLYNVAK